MILSLYGGFPAFEHGGLRLVVEIEGSCHSWLFLRDFLRGLIKFHGCPASSMHIGAVSQSRIRIHIEHDSLGN